MNNRTNQLMKKRKAIMKHRKDDQPETEVLILQEAGGSKIASETDASADGLTGSQRKLIEDLTRLQNSLRGPEILIDRTNYSRPFPPSPSRQDGKRYPDGEQSQEGPFGRTS
jgi:hypothetical protein